MVQPPTSQSLVSLPDNAYPSEHVKITTEPRVVVVKDACPFFSGALRGLPQSSNTKEGGRMGEQGRKRWEKKEWAEVFCLI